MARRKNSAEMLDVLRRMSQDEKVRRTRQLQREAGAVQPAARSPGLALPPPAGGRPARALPPPGPGEDRPPIFAPAPGPEESQGAVGDAALPERMRKSFISVVRGGVLRG